MNGATQTGWDYVAHGIPTAWQVVGAADLNGDGKPDLLWQNQATGDVSVWYMNGATQTGWAPVGSVPDLNWKVVGAGNLSATASTFLTGTRLTANKSAPQMAGTTITFTATATGGIPPYEYQWWMWNGSAWSVLQDWTSSAGFTWTPTSGNAAYQIAVHVRSSGQAWNPIGGDAVLAFAISAAGPPNILGTYNLSGSIHNDFCTDPLDSGKTIPFTATIRITSQSGSSFAGNVTITTDIITNLSMTGTVNVAGQVTGTFTSQIGNLPFTGPLVGNSSTLFFSGKIIEPEPGAYCNISGSMSLTSYSPS